MGRSIGQNITFKLKLVCTLACGLLLKRPILVSTKEEYKKSQSEVLDDSLVVSVLAFNMVILGSNHTKVCVFTVKKA